MGVVGRIMEIVRPAADVATDGQAQRLLAVPWVARQAAPGWRGTLRELADRTVRVAVSADGAGALVLRPETAAARELLADARARERLAALVFPAAVDDAADGARALRTITLTHTRSEYEAAAAVAYLTHQPVTIPGRPTTEWRSIVSGVVGRTAADTRDQLAFMERGEQLVAGPDVSAPLLAMLGDTTPVERIARGPVGMAEAAHAVLHETTHLHNRPGGEVRWLLEGFTESLVRWPGAFADFLGRTGLPARVRDLRPEYNGYGKVSTLATDLLRLAGVDPMDPAARAAALDLYRGADDGIHVALAGAIGRHHRLTAADTQAVEHMLAASGEGTLAEQFDVAAIAVDEVRAIVERGARQPRPRARSAP